MQTFRLKLAICKSAFLYSKVVGLEATRTAKLSRLLRGYLGKLRVELIP